MGSEIMGLINLKNKNGLTLTPKKKSEVDNLQFKNEKNHDINRLTELLILFGF